MTSNWPTFLIPMAAGIVAALLGVPAIAAAMVVAAPLALVVLAIGVAALVGLHRSADAGQRPIVRSAWKASAWLLVAAAGTIPMLNAQGTPANVFAIVASGLLAIAVDLLGNRLLPESRQTV